MGARNVLSSFVIFAFAETILPMGLISLIAALLIEQWRPLSDRRYLYSQVARYANFLERQFNAGEAQHGIVAWLVAVLPPVLLARLAHAPLFRWSPLFWVPFHLLRA